MAGPASLCHRCGEKREGCNRCELGVNTGGIPLQLELGTLCRKGRAPLGCCQLTPSRSHSPGSILGRAALSAAQSQGCAERPSRELRDGFPKGQGKHERVSLSQDQEQLHSCSAMFSQAWVLRSNPGRELGSRGSTSTSGTEFPSAAHSFTSPPLPYPQEESEEWNRVEFPWLERETRLSLRGEESCDPLVSLRGLRRDNVGLQSTRTKQRFCVWKVIQDKAGEGELSQKGH